MGLESSTTAIVGRKRYAGKLHLDSKCLSFKGNEFKWSAELEKPIVANVVNDRLVVEQEGTKVAFEIGSRASKWVEKILNPPSRMTKLGVKSGQRVWVSPGFGQAFRDELKQCGATRKRQIHQADLAIWRVTDRDQLVELDELVTQILAGVNLWIVWTKGSQSIGQSDVMEYAKQLGFGPSKTAAFDDEHSSMRFARKK